mmetsp:Transcript_324/g.192  ORF Transcript_324/g.192 Transcript_324/m.192 type:complete len:132 (+) Transcript_324:494-889(+)
MLGITFAVIAMISIDGFSIKQIVNDVPYEGEVQLFNLQQVLGHIGVAMLVFEGNAVIMNIRSEAKDQKKYPLMMTISIIVCMIVFIVYSIIAYLGFKDETNDIITLNLPPNYFGITIICMICINALCSFPV